MSHQRRNEENFRGGQQHGGGQQNFQQGGQQGGRQEQHSQYSGEGAGQYGGRQYGGPTSGSQYGGNEPYPYPPSSQSGSQALYGNQQPFAPGQERQWGPSSEQTPYQDYGRDERQFTGHYGASDDPYRSGNGPAGWTPSRQGGDYGSRGFGATGHGHSGYSGLGTFHNEPRDFGAHFNQQQFDQFGREQLGRDQFGQQGGQHDTQRLQQPHRDPHYQQWREDQLRRFDEDYEQWHQERYQAFSNDFNDWRARRQASQPQGAQRAQGNASTKAGGGAAAGSEVGGDLSDTPSSVRSNKPDEGQQSTSKGGK